MDVHEAIRNRRSIRAYREDPVPEDKLRRVLEAARNAPSAKNRQEWRFIAVREAGLRKKLAEAACSQEFVGRAPVILVACATEDKDVMTCGQKTGSVDCSIALAYVTLAAVAEGLGTCWLGAFHADKVRKVLGIPASAAVVALAPLGYPAEQPPSRGRRSFEEVVSFEKW